MGKTITKEIIIILLLIIAIILIIGVFLYGYLPINKMIPETVTYSASESVKNVISTDANVDMENIVVTYQIDSTDLSNYKTVKELEVYGENLKKKINKDIFNYGLALKGIRNIIDKNIKSEYIDVFCSTDTNLKNLINIDDRIYLYIYFLESLLEDIREEI